MALAPNWMPSVPFPSRALILLAPPWFDPYGGVGSGGEQDAILPGGGHVLGVREDDGDARVARVGRAVPLVVRLRVQQQLDAVLLAGLDAGAVGPRGEQEWEGSSRAQVRTWTVQSGI